MKAHAELTLDDKGNITTASIEKIVMPFNLYRGNYQVEVNKKFIVVGCQSVPISELDEILRLIDLDLKNEKIKALVKKDTKNLIKVLVVKETEEYYLFSNGKYGSKSDYEYKNISPAQKLRNLKVSEYVKDSYIVYGHNYVRVSIEQLNALKKAHNILINIKII